MKVTALVILLGIGLLAWYHYPDPPPDPAATTAPPDITPAAPVTSSSEQRLARDDEVCREFEQSPQWPYLKRAYPGMSDIDLCDYLLAPDVAKLQGVNVDVEAIEDLLNSLMSEVRDDNEHYADVPDLRYYLDPQAVDLMRGLTQQQLVDKINNEHSAEAAYWLAQHYHHDEQMQTTLMLIAASYSRKTGLFINALNGCCSWTPGDSEGQRAAAIKREALSMIAKELGLPEAQKWPDLSPTEEITAEVLAQRAAYVEEINEYSMQAHGEAWIK
ncbi:MAG: hypothetical protein ACR2QS_12425 [Woeseiaceae bacterium]